MTLKKVKINIVDFIIIASVVMVSLLVYRYINKEVGLEMETICYTVELTNQNEGFTELVQVGDELLDEIRNYEIGTIVAAKKVPYTVLAPNKELGKVEEVVIEGRENTVITIEASAAIDSESIRVNGVYTIKCGQVVSIKGAGYIGEGTLLSIER